MPSKISQDVDKEWEQWIDKEIDSKGPNTDILKGWNAPKKKMPIQLSTALWLIKNGIQDAHSFSTLFGLFSNDNLPKKYKQKYWHLEYLTGWWVNEYVVNPISQIIAALTHGEEEKRILTENMWVDFNKYGDLIAQFREMVRIVLVLDVLEIYRNFGPDPKPEQERVQTKLWEYARQVAGAVKGVNEESDDTMGVMEAMLLSLPMYIKKAFADNASFMLLNFPESMSNKWKPDAKLSDFRIQIPMVDLATETVSFDCLKVYFRAVLSGTVNPPPYEEFQLENKPKRSPRKNAKSKQEAIKQESGVKHVNTPIAAEKEATTETNLQKAAPTSFTNDSRDLIADELSADPFDEISPKGPPSTPTSSIKTLTTGPTEDFAKQVDEW